MFLLGSFSGMHAQGVVSDYAFSESTGVGYTDITTLPGYVPATNSIISGTFANVANFSTAYPIGFNFVYNNTVFTDVYISDNGYFIFKSPIGVTPLPAVTIVAPISNTTAYLGAVAGYGVQLTGTLADGADISYLTTGSAGSRIFTVQYKNLRRNNLANRDNVMNFQIRLYEANNQIEVLFRDFTTTYPTQFKGQVGLRGTSNADFNNRKNTASSNFTPSTGVGTVNTDGMITQLVGATVWGPLPGTSFVWTPCFNPTTLVLALQGSNTAVDFSWTAPQYLNGTTYDWEVKTTAGSPGTGGTFATGTTSSTTATVTGLTVGQIYYFFVRSSCKTRVPWTLSPAVSPASDYITGNITPLCTTPVLVPYYQDFETALMPAVPLCTLATPVVDQPFVVRNYGVWGFGSKNLITGGNLGTGLYGTGSTNATDTWWFSRGITLATAGKYKLTYTYGGTREQAFFIQKMKVNYGPNQSPTGMILLADHNNIKTTPNTFSLNFTVTAGGTYFLGFEGYAGANNGYLQIDDVSLLVSTCFAPTALTASQIQANAANISWTAPASSPSGGYEYYYSTSATTPTATTTPKGTTASGTVLASLLGLNSATTYYYWVRSSCGGSDFSEWSPSGPFFTTLNPPCTPAPTSVDGTGITHVVFGTVDNTTGDEPGHYGDYTAMINNVSQTTNANISLTYSTAGFGYFTRVWIDWNNDGDFSDTNELMYDSVTELPSGTSAISFLIPSSNVTVANTAGPHRMRIGGADVANATWTGTGVGQGPCYLGNVDATFEDYTINVIPPPPPLTLSSTTTTYCSGLSSPLVTLTSAEANFTSYNWSPSSNVTGSSTGGWTFNPTASTIYTLTATILTGGNLYTNTATYNVTVNPVPTAITITPAAPSYCQGDAPMLLTASGGIVSGVTIFNENFNGGTNTFTLLHASTAGTPALAWWLLHPSPYSIPAANNDDPMTISSNDATQFYMSDSDIQGSLGQTNEELISPSFSLVGYSDANLSFWHYYKGYGNGSAVVEISVNGAAYTALPSATWTTVTQGAPAGFVNVVLPLSAYAFTGNANNNVKIRFKYVANFAWRWCIDNVKVTGSSPAQTVWSPNTQLYTNSTGATAYNGTDQRATIWTKPTAAITYTATVTTPGPAFCPTTKTVTVAFVALVAGTATGDQTISCGSLPTLNLAVTGYTPTVARWESANNAAFTGFITVPGSTGLATLTPAVLGIVSTKTYYRAVIVGCNTVYSNTVIIDITAPNTWDGSTWSGGAPTSSDAIVIDGDLTIGSDLSVCSMKVMAARNVSVSAGVTLTVENAVDIAPTALVTFEDTASLLQGSTTTANTNSGYIKYKKSITIREMDYTYWSTPVNPQTLFNLSNLTLSDKYGTWNTTFARWDAIPGSTNMTTGLGYIIRGPEGHAPFPAAPAVWNLGFFNGVPNNGDYSVAIVKNSAAFFNDMNLIGNPYPSALDADLFVLNNPLAFPTGTTMYFWSHNLAINPITLQYDQPNQFALYNSSGGTGAGSPATGINNLPPTGKIATGQGFFIKGTFAGTGTQTAYYHNNMRVSGNNDRFYRTSQLEKNRVWLDLTDSSQNYKQILVGYIQNATNGFEEGFDGEILPLENPIDLYSINDTRKLGIQGRALPFDANDQVPLGLKTTAVGSYSVALSRFDGLFNDETVGIYLEDRLLNVFHNLRQSPYTFVSEIGTFDTRFVLRFTDSALGVNPVDFDANNVVAFKSNDDIHVETSNLIMKSVKILDIRGRVILERNNINKNSMVFENVGVANQVLVVQITSVDGSVVNKKIIF
eukprot:gene21671-28043_t